MAAPSLGSIYFKGTVLYFEYIYFVFLVSFKHAFSVLKASADCRFSLFALLKHFNAPDIIYKYKYIYFFYVD